MRAMAGAFAALLLLALLLVPSAVPPARAAPLSAGTTVACSTSAAPVSDGRISPSEYPSDVFDPATDLLVYLACDNATGRPLHVAVVSPWPGWVGLLVQASETWDANVNEVRLARDPTTGGVRVLDAFGNATVTGTPDTSAGGTTDVESPTAGTAGAATVFEFSIPLNSTDPHDSRLASIGPFAFALEVNDHDPDLTTGATSVSEFAAFVFSAEPLAAEPTTVEFTAGLSTATPGTIGFLVSVRNATGYPLAYALVEAYVETAFGMYDLGPVGTNDQGVGEVSYAPRENGTFVLGAAFAGDDAHLASVEWSALTVGSASGGGSIGLGLVGGSVLELSPILAAVVVVVLGVWATYAYAFYVTWLSMHVTPKSPEHAWARPFKRREIK